MTDPVERERRKEAWRVSQNAWRTVVRLQFLFILFVLPTGILLGSLTGINILITVGAVLLVTVLALLTARFFR